MTNYCGCLRLFRMPKINECEQAYLSQFNEFNEHTKPYTYLHLVAVPECEKYIQFGWVCDEFESANMGPHRILHGYLSFA